MCVPIDQIVVTEELAAGVKVRAVTVGYNPRKDSESGNGFTVRTGGYYQSLPRVTLEEFEAVAADTYPELWRRVRKALTQAKALQIKRSGPSQPVPKTAAQTASDQERGKTGRQTTMLFFSQITE
ncbi:MAG TPA: hypothetical protein VJG85_02650 [Patescibacteria group bacterium]|nr:hypothetical protein [Patescibacteria group bacterium]